MRLFYTTLLTLAIGLSAAAQTPAGNAFRIDYDEFQSNGAIKYFNCGNNEMLNTGSELTVMTWVQFRDLGDNQKIVGKFNLDNTGFILACAQGRVYAEVWNPTHYEPLDGLMNPTAEYWHHLAFTYSAGGEMKTYINGLEVGSIPVSDNDVASSDNDLIIGVSSWTDLNSFQSFGNIDETAVFNVALSAEEIRQQVFKPMLGTETGLVAGYDYNVDSGDALPDITGNGNTGTSSGNFTGSEWVTSMAPLANELTAGADDLWSIWNGLSFMDPRFSTSTSGMNMLATGLGTTDYVTFGNDGATGITADDAPASAPADFMRAARVFPVTAMSSTPLNVIMNLEQAAGGMMLDATQNAANYSLIRRSGDSGEFEVFAQGTSITNGVVTFEDVSLFNGQYSIGVSGSPIEPSSVFEEVITDAITISPNPSKGSFDVLLDSRLRASASMNVLDISGRLVYNETFGLTGNSTRRSVDISGFGPGMYTVAITAGATTYTQKLIVE